MLPPLLPARDSADSKSVPAGSPIEVDPYRFGREIAPMRPDADLNRSVFGRMLGGGTQDFAIECDFRVVHCLLLGFVTFPIDLVAVLRELRPREGMVGHEIVKTDVHSAADPLDRKIRKRIASSQPITGESLSAFNQSAQHVVVSHWIAVFGCLDDVLQVL